MMEEKVLENGNELQKFIVLLADINDEPIHGQLKLQKIMFLVSEIVEKVKEQSKYEVSDYGPYSEIVEKELHYLEQIGVLTSKGAGITVTKEGKEIAKEIMDKVEMNIIGALSEYKKFLNNLSSDELLAYVYSAYPDMIEGSVEYEKLKPNMEYHILSLVKKQKLNAHRVSELLNKPLAYVLELMKERGISDNLTGSIESTDKEKVIQLFMEKNNVSRESAILDCKKWRPDLLE